MSQTAVTNSALGPGSVYRINPDGSGFTVLKQFFSSADGGWPDGAWPQSGLVLDGTTLYGTTTGGGTNRAGTVFRLSMDGSNFTVLNHFSVGHSGYEPMALALCGSNLWGVAEFGGNPGDQGTVFEVDTNGSTFSTYWFFYGADGRNPMNIFAMDSWLYGTTQNGGNSFLTEFGSLFRMKCGLGTGGSGFAKYLFSGSDGEAPAGGLVLCGTNLYGTATRGGTNDSGTLYRISTNLSGLVVLRHFTSDDGGPSGNLVLSGNTLYGATGGGSGGYGSVFKVNTDGTGYTVLKWFTGSDGSDPDSLLLSGTTLYGTTQNGGDFSGLPPPFEDPGAGVLFSLSLGLALVNPGPQGTNFAFSFQTSSNVDYTVEYNDDLNTTNWRVTETLVGDGSLLRRLLPMTNTAHRFFRVRQQ
jgi:uncharacterized repeat protein (TIGR03803 family)